MVRSRRFAPALALACALTSLLLSASQSRAEAPPAPEQPATVTVRVEGLAHTLLASTQVTTTTAAVIKDGSEAHACAGTSAAGALQLATSGSWNGTWFTGLGYSIETLEGESHVFEKESQANYFWSFWLNDAESSAGICGAQLHASDRLLFFPACFGPACPPPATPLEIEAPASVEVGAPFAVTVKSYDSAGKPSPAVGATVTGEGAGATTDGAGHATLVLRSLGEATLQASAASAVRTEATVCVHQGNDGRCGTSLPAVPAAPGTSQAPAAAATQSSRYTGPFAVVARVSGLLEGHFYRHGQGPRLLAGTVSAHTAVTDVSISLRGRRHGRCFAYDGRTERLHAARCGRDAFFHVSTAPSFSYLLPFALPTGRYVLDLAATDAWGNHTTLARGTSRTVFHVG